MYGFHPAERFSFEIGRILQNDSPQNTDVIIFRPSCIYPDYLELSWKERVELTYLGNKELRKYALERYGQLPFIINLHDYPLYAWHNGEELELKYELTYPAFNLKLGKKLQQCFDEREIRVRNSEMQVYPGYHALNMEFYPIRFRPEKKTFEILTSEEAVDFVRKVVDFLRSEPT